MSELIVYSKYFDTVDSSDSLLPYFADSVWAAYAGDENWPWYFSVYDAWISADIVNGYFKADSCWNYPVYGGSDPACSGYPPGFKFFPLGTFQANDPGFPSLHGDFLWFPNTSNLVYIGSSGTQVEIKIVYGDPFWCWKLTYELKNGKIVSQEGPGRFPSTFLIPDKDIKEDSCILVEDGIIIPRSKYNIKIVPREGYF